MMHFGLREKKNRMKTFVRMSERKVAKETRANACECRALKLSGIMNERGTAQMKKTRKIFLHFTECRMVCGGANMPLYKVRYSLPSHVRKLRFSTFVRSVRRIAWRWCFNDVNWDKNVRQMINGKYRVFVVETAPGLTIFYSSNLLHFLLCTSFFLLLFFVPFANARYNDSHVLVETLSVASVSLEEMLGWLEAFFSPILPKVCVCVCVWLWRRTSIPNRQHSFVFQWLLLLLPLVYR